MNNFTKAQVNILTQLAWDAPAKDDEKAVYESWDATKVLQMMLDSRRNKDIRTKAAWFDRYAQALKDAYAMIEQLKKQGSSAVSQAKIDAIHKEIEDVRTAVSQLNT